MAPTLLQRPTSQLLRPGVGACQSGPLGGGGIHLGASAAGWPGQRGAAGDKSGTEPLSMGASVLGGGARSQPSSSPPPSLRWPPWPDLPLI